MQLTLAIDEKTLINEVMSNYPEYSYTMRCIEWTYDECRFTFVDDEDGKFHTVDRDMLTRALPKFFEHYAANKQIDMLDAANWDAEDTDILVQLAIFGEVIYG